MDGLIRPNKTFVAEYLREIKLKDMDKFKRTVVITAESEAVAKAYLKDIVGSEPDELTWLMDCNYKVIRDQTGSDCLPVQAKILYSTHAVVK